MTSEIQKRIERKGLVISRIPIWARDLFIERAKEEFCDDYGMCLSAMIKECGEFSQLKKLFFDNKLNLNSDNIVDEKSIKFANGHTIKYNGGTK
ncbi:MAG TPA: hypothetical protein ENI61_05375 [Ignavibacteria bacterium]|nr:hypothetical protein [Ignavibacteria bacterium]